MKELSIEEKAKRYDEAYNVAEKIHNFSSDIAEVKRMEQLFPELKESEDERIRKKIISAIHLYYGEPLEDEAKEMIDWLEKQGEQIYPIDTTIKDKIRIYIANHFITDTVVETDVKSIVKAMEEGVRIGMSEQKPADKVEPKFKVGDWIIDVQGVSVNQIIGYEDDSYLIKTSCSQFYLPMKLTETNYHKWTIQDAKDGDVLNSVRVNATIIFKGFTEDGKHIVAYCALQKGIFIKQEMLWDRDFELSPNNWIEELFQKMKEAGYTFDFEKKELKKISQRMVSAEAKEAMYNKPAEWTAEDEEELKIALNTLEEAGQHSSAKWLKNVCLIPQNRWKPSEEQIDALEDAIADAVSSIQKNMLNSLYQDLQKLR